MTPNNFYFEIVTPLSSFLKTDVESIIIDTPTGKMGIQAFHEPTVIGVSDGEIKIKRNGEWKSILVSGGFMEVTNEEAIVFVDTALWPDEVTQNEEKLKEELQNEKKQREISKEEHVKMQSFITKAINNIKVEKTIK